MIRLIDMMPLGANTADILPSAATGTGEPAVGSFLDGLLAAIDAVPGGSGVVADATSASAAIPFAPPVLRPLLPPPAVPGITLPTVTPHGAAPIGTTPVVPTQQDPVAAAAPLPPLVLPDVAVVSGPAPIADARADVPQPHDAVTPAPAPAIVAPSEIAPASEPHVEEPESVAVEHAGQVDVAEEVHVEPVVAARLAILRRIVGRHRDAAPIDEPRPRDETDNRTAEIPIVSAHAAPAAGGAMAIPSPMGPTYLPHELRLSAPVPAPRPTVDRSAALPPPTFTATPQRQTRDGGPDMALPTPQPHLAVQHDAGVPAISTGAPVPASNSLPPPSVFSAPPARVNAPVATLGMTGTAMAGVERVRFAREQAPSRAVQRLSLDLDGAQVAVRFHHDRVAVDVVDDPSGTLGPVWAKQVERTLDHAVRTAMEPPRADSAVLDQPPARPADTSGRHGGEGSGGGHPDHPAQERQQQQQRRWHHALATDMDEDD